MGFGNFKQTPGTKYKKMLAKTVKVGVHSRSEQGLLGATKLSPSHLKAPCCTRYGLTNAINNW